MLMPRPVVPDEDSPN